MTPDEIEVEKALGLCGKLRLGLLYSYVLVPCLKFSVLPVAFPPFFGVKRFLIDEWRLMTGGDENDEACRDTSWVCQKADKGSYGRIS